VHLDDGIIINSLSYTEFKEILKKLKLLPEDNQMPDNMKGLDFELFEMIRCTLKANVE